MAFVLKDRVKENSSTTGTGTLTLSGAVDGFQAFSAIGDGNTTYYAIVHQDGSVGEWETGIGTYTSSGTTLARTTVFESSNSGSAVSFSAGVKDVYVTYPSSKSVYVSASPSFETVSLTGDTTAGDDAAIGYTSTEGLILTGQGSTNDVTIKNDADADVITIATGGTNVDIVGDITASTINADGDTSAGDSAAIGYTSTEGLILTGQGSTNDITIKNDADADVITIATGGTNVDIVGDVTAATFKPDGDTSASDTAAIGYTASEGLILTGQGSTSDITLKNDADGTVFTVPTGSDDISFPDNAAILMGTGNDLKIFHNGSNSQINDLSTGNLQLLSNGTGVDIMKTDGEYMARFATDGAVTLYHDNSAKLATDAAGVAVTGNLTTTGTVEPAGDTSAGDTAIGYTSIEGLILTGHGSTSDLTVKNNADATVFTVPTGTDDILFPDGAKAMWGDSSDLTIHHDSNNSYISDTGTGNLYVLASVFAVNNVANSAAQLIATDGGAVELYHNGSKKFNTESTGATLTGKLVSSGNGENFISKTTSQYGGLAFQNSSGTREGLIDYDHTNGVLGIKAHTTNHYITFQTGGYNDRLLIAADGKIGISEASPDSIVHITSSSDELRVENTGTAQWNSARIRLKGPASDDRSTQIIHGNTNVGGTNTRYAVELSDASDNWVQTQLQYDYNSRFWAFTTGTGAGSERMRIDTNGRIAISHTTPDSESLVDMGSGENSGYTRKLTVVNTGNSRFGLGAASNEARIFYADDQAVRWKTLTRDGNFTASEKMVLTAAGDLGVGTSSPSAQAHIVSGASNAQICNANVGHYFESQSNDNTPGFEIYQQHASNTTRNSFIVNDNRTGSKSASFLVRNDGRVGISEDSPDTELHVDGYITASKGTVQTVIARPNTTSSNNSVDAWAEPHSDYRVQITPKHADSNIHGAFQIPINPTGAANILFFLTPWVSTDGGTNKTILEGGVNSGARINNSSSSMRSLNGYDANDMQSPVIHFYYDCSSTTQLTFGFYNRSEGTNTVYFCHSNVDNGDWGWTAPMYLELREVRP